ncbi:hypothetical protein [Bradyrhizobium oligotrophicum]|uniref:hypothetical protein n=1 Tax=Bradyrhizobium oligotrophicum TaxID=44255 RepID=UPI003EBD0142
MAVPTLQIPQLGAVSGGADFAPLANLGNIYKQAQQEQQKREALSALASGDPSKMDIRPLLASGDMSLAQLGINLRNRDQDLQRQAARDAISDKHWAASYELQKRAAARADEDKPLIKEVTDPNTGMTGFVRINPRTGELTPLGGQQPSAPANPFSQGGKFNGDQAKAAGFTDRMLQSEGLLSGVAPDSGIGPPSPGLQGQGAKPAQTMLSKIPVVGNYAVSEDRQKYDQAKRDFINAQLRRESGAAISQGEFDSAEKQYFPVPGDGPEVIKQKAANRRAAVEAMGREGGQSYRPKFVFDPSGAVKPLGGQQPAATSSPQQGPISKSQYDALPSGSTFMAPDGNMRVKP